MAAQPRPDREHRYDEGDDTGYDEDRRTYDEADPGFALHEVDEPVGTPAVRPEGRNWTTASFILAVVAVFLLPIVAATVGVFVGLAGLRRGDPLARWAIGANVVIVVLSIVAAIAVSVG